MVQAEKQGGKPAVPLVPVVASGDGVKLVTEMTLRQQRGKFAIRRQQSFLFSAGQKEIGRGLGIGGSGQQKRIIVAPRLTSGGSKNRAVVARLMKTLEDKCPVGNVDG